MPDPSDDDFAQSDGAKSLGCIVLLCLLVYGAAAAGIVYHLTECHP